MTAAGTINIASHLAVMAERQPEAVAVVVCFEGPFCAVQELKYSYRQLNDWSDALAQMSGVGITRGMRTAVCVRPGLNFFAITFGLFKLGAVPVLIDPGIGVRNFGRCLAEAEPAAFVGFPAAHVARRVLGWAKKTVLINVTTGWFGGVSLREVERRGMAAARLASDTGASPVRGVSAGKETRSSNPPVTRAGETPVSPSASPAAVSKNVMVDSAPDDPAAILFTSGSTGPPKGVLYTHANFDAQVRALREVYDIRPGEVDLATFPLFGLFGPALGMTTVVPKMDFTRPGHVDPRNILEPIRQFEITNMFGSPALLDRVGAWASGRGMKLPSLKRVISAGAPVPAGVIERFASMLPAGAQVFTPYGATESLPVSSIGSDEILGDTRRLTDEGKGVCVGRPVTGMRAKIIRISDEPIETWSDDLELPAGQIGEIVVQGPVVTREYFNRSAATKLAKIADAVERAPSPGPPGEGGGGGSARLAIPQSRNPGSANPLPNPPPEYRERELEEHREGRQNAFWHRMGDVGYFDESGRLWFCGRKSQRVRMACGDLFSAPFEGVFNTHPMVARSALVGVERGGVMRPVMCIELKLHRRGAASSVAAGGGSGACCTQPSLDQIRSELRALAALHEHTRIIQDFLFHPGFPVDIRHNAKIGREKLAAWAARKLK